jgi:ribosomal protein S18 acetylase RimI-like enzyme
MPRNLKIEERLRSASKATRNDPRPTPPPEYYIRLVNEGLPDDTSDKMADSSSDDVSFASHSSKYDIFAEFEWLEQIDGLMFNQDDSDSHEIQVGYCDGKLIRREDIRAKFRFAMEEPTEETCSLAFDLFDRYGLLKPEFKVHPVKKGSDIWNTELDDGDIFLIESLSIDRQYRRLGQGSALVRAMLEKVRDKTLGFVSVVRPGVLRSELLCEPSGGEVLNKESSELAARDISNLSGDLWGFVESARLHGLGSPRTHNTHVTV